MTSECSKLITELTKTRDSSRKSEIISELSEVDGHRLLGHKL